MLVVKNINKKSGFTIVELLIVIVVIGILAAITIISYTGVNAKARTAQAQSNAGSVKSAVEVMNVDNGLYPVSIGAVVQGSSSVKIPSNLSVIGTAPTSANGTNTISYEICGSTYPATSASVLGGRIGYYDYMAAQVKYYYVGSGVEVPTGSTPNCLTAYVTSEASVFSNGTAIYYNPVTGLKCTSAQAVSATGTKTGCMKWYTLSEGGVASDNIDLILDHNTTAKVAWNSTGSNLTGPTTVMSQLSSDTNSWVGVPARTDIYSLNNGNSNYSINYSGYRARLVSAGEIVAITNYVGFDERTTSNWFYLDSNTQTKTAKTIGASLYSRLFDYTSSCTTSGCNIADSSNQGYWTSTAVPTNSVSVWLIFSWGSLTNDGANVSNAYGLRPVITIPKTAIN